MTHPTDTQTPPQRPMLVIGGPTAAGKSGLALALAERWGGELVSADSAQVYRGMDIGTAKPTAEEQQRVPHHLIDVASIEEAFDVGQFVELADAAIADIRARQRWPIVVGGTGMYLRALIYGLMDAPPADPEVRALLKKRAEQEGAAVLHAELEHCDPVTAGRVHPNDAVRIVRALEVYRITGQPMSAHQRAHAVQNRPPRYPAWEVVVAPPRDTLYARINARVEVMLETGWVDEVRHLLAAGVDPDARPMQIMGYRHLIGWLLGRESLDRAECVRRIKRDHRRYAKRQLTWFRAQPGFSWYESAEAARQALLPRLTTAADGWRDDA
ncbi:MAG: tRNA (adenosine(37)-N6)-dimethylallyltransferase MiaA [Myxococcota bacterium]